MPVQALELFSRADELEDKAAQAEASQLVKQGRIDFNAGGMPAASAGGGNASRALQGAGVFVVSARNADLGSVLAASNTAPFVGAGVSAVVGRSINDFLPSPVREMHDALLRCVTGRARTRTLISRHRRPTTTIRRRRDLARLAAPQQVAPHG